MATRSKIIGHESLIGNKEIEKRSAEEAEIGNQAHDAVTAVTVQAVVKTSNRVMGMLVANAATIGALHVLAHCVSKNKDDALTPTQVLFASLLAYNSSPCEREFGVSINEYSPLIIFKTLNDCERFLGHKPDDELDSQMCRVCREWAGDPANIAKLNAIRDEHYTKAGLGIN